MGYIGKVPADVLIDPMVDSAAITDATIVTADIADDAVTSAKLAANSVDSSELIDGSIDNSHLAGSIAINKTLLAGGTGLTLSTNTLNVDAAQTQITSVGTLTSLTLGGNLDIPEYLRHDGDTDTHLRFSAADAIEITAGNVKMMRFLEDDSQDMVVINEDSADIDFRVESDNNTHALFVQGSDGKIGIGTSSPSFPLDVSMGSGATNAINIVGSSHGSYTNRATMGFNTNSAGDEGITIGSSFGDDTQDFYIYDLYDNALRMIINSSGLVGIGTTAPTAPLHIKAAPIQTSGARSAQLYIEDTTTHTSVQNSGIQFRQQWQSGSTTSTSAIVGTRTSTSSGNYGGALIFQTRAHGGDLADNMIIQDSGNVGIGTTSPVSPSGYSTTLALAAGGEGPAITFRDTGTSNKSSYILNQSGALKIGTMEDAGGGVTHQMMLRTGLSVFGAKVGSVDNNPDSYQISWGGDDVSNPRWGFRIDSSEDLFLDGNLNVSGRSNWLHVRKTTGYFENIRRLAINTSATYALDVYEDRDTFAQRIRNAHGNAYGIIISRSAGSGSANTDRKFLNCEDNSQNRLIIYSNGSVQNVDGTYGSSLSDERLKKDIVPAKSQWDDVKNIDIVNYKIATHGDDAKKLMSVVAQQVQKVSPNLIGERPPDKSEIAYDSKFGTLYEDGDELPEDKEIGDVKEEKEKVLFFKDSIFFWKCAKALQEAMAKIETLETKVKALESA